MLPWAACIAVRGDEAADFLRRQLTQNPPPDDTCFTLAAWNDARGRVRAVFRVLQHGAGLVLIAERDGVEALLAKLRMFVLRAKVEFLPLEDFAVAAVLGGDIWLREHGVALPDAPFSAALDDGISWLRVDSGVVHAVATRSRLADLIDRLPAVSADNAELAEIRLGWPRIGAALGERFVPQMLNLDRLGGVSFDKGCYPGQEVVARLHHLGQVKRRLHRFAAAEGVPPAPGAELVDGDGAPSGDVVRVARAGSGYELLAVTPLGAAERPLFVSGDATPLRTFADA